MNWNNAKLNEIQQIEYNLINSSDFRKSLNDTHRLILQAARKQRLINKTKNEAYKLKVNYKQIKYV